MSDAASPELTVAASAAEFRAACDAVRASGKKLGLVPTMGALHAGHLALVAEARKHGDAVALTIFVNPTQFGPHEDFAKYPRVLERDLELCRGAGVALVFTPPVAEMYPPGERTRVRVEGLTEHLCGPFRPGHFEGVATIVTKLFAVAGPSTAVFGRKDYQQLQVVRRMARDLLLPVEIVGYPTLRDLDGLALSSRNQYLSTLERERALAVPRGLSAAARAFAAGERRAGELRRVVTSFIEPVASRIDYVTVADPETLEPLSDDAIAENRALVALAAFVGTTRLIDNVVLGEDKDPLP
ncbi:MAG TPA: pantoate--beta-alanine ligase [Polyangiaceae bacterium]